MMGTSGAYTGSGSRDGRAVREAVADLITNLDTPARTLDPSAARRAVHLLRPRSHSGHGADGPSGGGGVAGVGRTGGGAVRSALASSRSAGRAAAAAAAYRVADAATLARLGLDYNELRSLGDDFEVLRRIVEAACTTADSTIEDHEQRLIAAEIAEWVLDRDTDGTAPSPEETVRHAIATIIAVTLLTEAGDLINNSDNAGVAECDIRDAAEALADRASLSVNGVTDAELSTAIEQGLDTLRTIVLGDDY